MTMIENSNRGITLNKSLAWTVACGLVGAGLWVGIQVATLRGKPQLSRRLSTGCGWISPLLKRAKRR